MRIPLAYAMNRLKKTINEYKQFMMNKLNEHQVDYQHGIIRDFADALISAKEEAIKEKQENIKHLNDENMMLTLGDLFSAGCELLFQDITD
jgi:Cytochrome P450